MTTLNPALEEVLQDIQQHHTKYIISQQQQIQTNSSSPELQLLSISLWRQNITDYDVQILCKSMYPGEVSQLDLEDNDITTTKHLVDFIVAPNSMLTYLDLSRNIIDDVGLRPLCQAIRKRRKKKLPITLKRLLLDDNQISDVGLTYLLSSLPSSIKNDIDLSVKNNPNITEFGLNKLQQWKNNQLLLTNHNKNNKICWSCITTTTTANNNHSLLSITNSMMTIPNNDT
jgi:hypothetical protein